MNKVCLTFIIASLASCHGSGVPTFSWLQSPLPVLKITYPNGLSDIAVLKSFNPIPVQSFERLEDVDPCIYNGYLANEKKVHVTLTGCAHTDTFNVQFRSQHLEHSMFSVVDGKVEAVESIFGKKEINRDGEYVMIRDEVIFPPQAEPQAEPEVTKIDSGMNPNGYQATIKIRYDDNFKAKFGSEAVNTIRRVFAQAQNIWMWPSLTTSVTFLVDPSVDAVSGKFSAATDVDAAGVYSTADYNVNLMMAFGDNQPGTVGMAYVGSLCYQPNMARYKVALCEYYLNDMKSAQIVAHEIGHNMGMSHDFFGKPGVIRKATNGDICTGIGGIMDYNGAKDKWSTCSVEDFAEITWRPGFCLKSN